MYELFAENPWLVIFVVGGVVAVGCTAIVFITDYLRKTHQAEVDADLKRLMLDRGMSAEKIKTVLEASGDPEHLLRQGRDEGLRLGCGGFQIEAGSLRRQTASPS
jgi:hypothetical protein